jgi:hypothetical protein
MGLFRYIVQGFGWEIGAQAAREGIDALEKTSQAHETAEPADPPSRRQAARIARAQRKAAERERARKHAQIEDQLRELKKKMS